MLNILGQVRTLFLLSVFLLGLTTCQKSYEKPKRPSRAKLRKVLIDSLSHFAPLPLEVKAPQTNPLSEEKIALGRFLFFDPILSGNKDIACATCHHPSNGFAESLTISIGVNGKGFGSKRVFQHPNSIPFTKRNSPTVINTAFNGIDAAQNYEPTHAPMFWDLRAKSLEAQALEPIKALEEMRGDRFSEDEILGEIVGRLNDNFAYNKLFQAAFPELTSIQSEHIAKAIASYERSLLTNDSRFDQFMRGDSSAISISEREGFETFKRVGCGMCHHGPMFSDYQAHVLGIAPTPKIELPDTGIDSLYAFRTPSLRNLRFTFPYMHNGSIRSIQQVLEFYEDIAAGKTRNPHVPKEALDPFLKSLRIRVKDMGAIASFLNTLNDDSFDRTVPGSVPSGLPVGGNIHN